MATGNFTNEYCVEDSDQEHATDSEDDITNFVLGTPKQRRHIRRRSLGQPSDSSEDEFEKEMESELKKKMDTEFSFQETAAAQSQSAKVEAENDALFYDPDMDDGDQEWVNKQRRIAHDTSGSFPKPSSAKDDKLPKTDAVLNCPACLCQLCTDCQRHTVYDGQYRAMFVTNCIVSYGETLRFKKQAGKRSRKRKHQPGGHEPTSPPMMSDLNNMEQVPPGPIDDIADEPGVSGGPNPEAIVHDDLYNPVHCNNCNTKVGLHDQDEVYHFFNVVTSYG